MSISLSVGTSFKELQSMRCTETPLERVTTPTIGSPGIGEQHLAIEYKRPSSPIISFSEVF